MPAKSTWMLSPATVTATSIRIGSGPTLSPSIQSVLTVDAVGERLDLAAGHPLGEGEQRVLQLGQRLGAVAADQLEVAALAGVDGRQLRPDVAEDHVRHAHVGGDDVEEGLVDATGLVEVDARAAGAPPGRSRSSSSSCCSG